MSSIWTVRRNSWNSLKLRLFLCAAELVGFDKVRRVWADGTIENQLDKALVSEFLRTLYRLLWRDSIRSKMRIAAICITSWNYQLIETPSSPARSGIQIITWHHHFLIIRSIMSIVEYFPFFLRRLFLDPLCRWQPHLPDGCLHLRQCSGRLGRWSC